MTGGQICQLIVGGEDQRGLAILLRVLGEGIEGSQVSSEVETTLLKLGLDKGKKWMWVGLGGGLHRSRRNQRLPRSSVRQGNRPERWFEVWGTRKKKEERKEQQGGSGRWGEKSGDVCQSLRHRHCLAEEFVPTPR